MDSSFEIPNHVLDEEDFNLDWNDINDVSRPEVMNIDYINNDIDPIKRPAAPSVGPATGTFSTPLSLNSKLILAPHSSNPVTNELFQVTHNMRRAQLPRKNQFDIFGSEEDSFLGGKRLNNNKIERMLEMGVSKKYGQDKTLGNDEAYEQKINTIMSNMDEDFELDDQLRTRFYKGRFTKESDGLDISLNSYLEQGTSSANEDKENLAPYPDPLKTIKNKQTHSIKKSNKVFFRSPRRNTSIPILRPLSNITNIERKEFIVKREMKSPKRICIPQHRSKFSLRPSIKHQEQRPNIFIVDSSSGSINDATKFGTELNASNCEDFPLPEDANEIVQIPTNDDKSKNQKMAIIKLCQGKFFTEASAETEQQPIGVYREQKKLGFYNPKQFDDYRSGTEEIEEKKEKKGVKWADNLEW